MVRRLRVLIEEYEEKVKGIEKSPTDYFVSLMEQEITPQEVHRQSKNFFAENYAILGFVVEDYPNHKSDSETSHLLLESFERNSRFTSRCMIYEESTQLFWVYYRIAEEDYLPRMVSMVKELQTSSKKEFGVELSVCIGKAKTGYAEFEDGVKEVQNKLCLRFLYGEQAIMNLAEVSMQGDLVIATAKKYDKLAEALFIADEKNLIEERERLFEIIEKESREEIEIHVHAAILAIAMRFERDHSKFSDVFNNKYNYIEKLSRLEEIRSIKIWLTNYFAWIMDYSATKLNVVETDVIVKAKRYIADNYEDAELSLKKVADYVGLNEKYFTNRFSKETGETFSSYVTKLRMQKAKELLKTTSFKIYEISEMVGYHNVEHFNRMFKKLNDVSPAQYRKTM